MKHCVQCGHRHPLYSNNRCKECFLAWDDAGRIRSERWVKDSGWMKVGGTHWFNYARHCRECGGKMPDVKTAGFHSRQLYALQRGGECITCERCYCAKHFPPSPCPSISTTTKP